MSPRSITATGWVLAAGIVALGATLVAGEYFKPKPPEGGYSIPCGKEWVSMMPMLGPTDFTKANIAKGAEVFKKCASCHTINAGGPNGIGPNLYSIMGKPHAHLAGFAYSPGMAAMKARTWDWEAMDKWLTSPKKYLRETKMSFAGLAKPQDRADVILYINSQGSNLPLPPPPPAAPNRSGISTANRPLADDLC